MLDTHVLLWWMQDNPRLGQRARALIADGSNDILVSAASPWEMSIKYRIGKLSEKGSDAAINLESEGFDLVPIQTAHLKALEELPRHHSDPFDHLIIAQARVENATLLTSDREMTAYGIKCFPAGR